MNDKVKELIELYEAILHGDKEKMGFASASGFQKRNRLLYRPDTQTTENRWCFCEFLSHRKEICGRKTVR